MLSHSRSSNAPNTQVTYSGADGLRLQHIRYTSSDCSEIHNDVCPGSAGVALGSILALAREFG